MHEDQLKMAYEALKHSPDSRQITLQFWNKSLDMPNPEIRSKDVPCNLVSHLMVRDGKLEWLQVLRSNDFFWGLPYNIIQFTTLQEIMAGWLNIEPGSYVQLSDSLHVYQRHWQDLASVDSAKTTVPQNHADLRISSYNEWESTFRTMVKCALELTECTEVRQLISVENEGSNLPPSYRELLTVLTAEALRRGHFHQEAKEAIVRTSPFWRASWEKWAASTAQNILAQ
jgi:thymidylate synthase